MNPERKDAGAEWAVAQIRASYPVPAEGPTDVEAGLRRLGERQAARRRRRQRWQVAVTGVVALAAAAAWVPETRVYAARCVDACVAGVLSTVQPLQGKQAAEAPDFALRNIDGKLVRLSDYRGQVVLLNFWATWCEPCRAEMPWFVAFQRDYEARGFTVLGVSVDEEGWEAVRPYLQREGVNYPVVVSDGKTTEPFGGVETLPTTLLIDRKGRVTTTHRGLVSRDVYEGSIREALQQKE